MSLVLGRGSKVALTTSQCFLHSPQRRTVSISSAIHKGLHRDTDRRERRQPDFSRRSDLPRDRESNGVRDRAYRPSSEYGEKRGRQFGQRAQGRENRRSHPPWGESEENGEYNRPAYAERHSERQPEPHLQRRRWTEEHGREVPRPKALRQESRDFTRDSNRNTRRGPNRNALLSENALSHSSSYPLSVPHTTAASQFLYGYSTVYAALRAGRRTCYNLYLHTRGAIRDEQAREHDSLLKLALRKKVRVVAGDQVDVRVLDKMSEGRPHNV
jgi:21S rRNA (GM2251-2'-O)-methyltransferase